MKPLYKIADEFVAIVAALEQSDMPEDVIADTLEGAAGELEDKAIAVAAFIKNCEAEAAMIKEAEKAMDDRRKALENKAAKLKEYLLIQMQRCNKDKIKAVEFDLTIKKNPPSIIIDDETKIPAWFKSEKVVIEVDKAAIKAEIDAGKEVEGAHREQKSRLEIK